MGAVRIAILAAAAVAAILLAFIVRGMVGADHPAPQAVSVAEAQPVTKVLVAKQDLPIGTRISAQMIGWQDWPVDSLSESFITDGVQAAPAAEGAAKVAETATQAAHALIGGPAAIQAFEGAVVREAMVAGEPILARKVLRGGEGGFMSVVLGSGMRAVSIPISAESASGGFILPGDRVQVELTPYDLSR
ncbi:MAG TPA: Flp pilus assembly protein CpaB, partial [Phenylobacterium sp.]|nr:Flp pilus assembly protein CpaB [Phenylobacterium sp.]